jgi:hypothetical protein
MSRGTVPRGLTGPFRQGGVTRLCGGRQGLLVASPEISGEEPAQLGFDDLTAEAVTADVGDCDEELDGLPMVAEHPGVEGCAVREAAGSVPYRRAESLALLPGVRRADIDLRPTGRENDLKRRGRLLLDHGPQ